MPEISVIIPCRNDAQVLDSTLDALHQVVTHNSLSVETLVVDDESTDATIEIALAAAAKFPALHIRPLARPRRTTPTTIPSMSSGSSFRSTLIGSNSLFSGSSHTTEPSWR